MTKKKGLLLAVVVFVGLSYACGHDSSQSTESKPSTSQSQEAKAPSKSQATLLYIIENTITTSRRGYY